MATFIFIIGTLVIIGGILINHLARKGSMKLAGFGAVALGLIIVTLTMVSTVNARSVGVKTSFGKYSGAVGPGFNVTSPWTSVEEWTTRNQTIRFAGDGKQDEHENYYTEPAITVRLGNQSQAYVDATVTWKVTEESVGPLWQQYKTFEDARRDFATPNALAAVNAAFDGYDPFKAINAQSDAQPAAPAAGGVTPVSDPTKAAYVPLEQWSKLVIDKLKSLYSGRHVELVNVQVTQVTYDKRTEDKLREYADAVANTRIKAQDVETAKKEAEASAARAKQAGQGCEALVRDLASQNKLKDVAPGVQICTGANSGGVVVGTK